MSTESVTIRRTELDSGIVELMEDSDLPTSDIQKDKTLFFEAVRNSDRIGVGALQLEDSVGLLRSVAIKEKYRGMDYGTHLVDTLVGEARKQNLDGLYLLTTGAAPFFKQLGFEKISRDDLPASIQSTRQVRTLCPDSATCMVRSLREET